MPHTIELNQQYSKRGAQFQLKIFRIEALHAPIEVIANVLHFSYALFVSQEREVTIPCPTAIPML